MVVPQPRISALGLDVGNRRIGVAGCDGLGLLATGLGVVHRRSFRQDIAALQSWIDQRQAQILVVGIPLLADGSAGSQARQVKSLMRRMRPALKLPVEYVNERLTTVQASWDLHANGINTHGQKHLIDQQAAAVILQMWLDQMWLDQRRAQPFPPPQPERDPSTSDPPSPECL
ncbi:MAG: Holliday junction resolvase RuvX [Synechococcaceae cyanobacterium RM1_1_27]|nr:Holliday junction resolvase RuvX [Synechococcaceae cyanobacterium RM1_1_27]